MYTMCIQDDTWMGMDCLLLSFIYLFFWRGRMGSINLRNAEKGEDVELLFTK